MQTEKIVAMVLSIAGMLVTVVSFQARKKRDLLLFQTGGTVLYLVSYFFSEGGIAVALNVVYLVRNVLFMAFHDKNKTLMRVTAACLCVCYVGIYAVYAAVVETQTSVILWYLLPVAGALFGTCAVVCKNVNALRAWKMGDSVCWLAYNIHIGLGALGGILGEVLNLISQTVGIVRFHGVRRSLRKAQITANEANDHEESK